MASQLEYHNFVIFLCYGSLWGEIRQSQLFPWAHKAELCILEDHLVEYGRDDFVSDFERNHLKIQYIAADGYYYIESNSIGWSQTISKPFVELYIFAKDRKVNAGRHFRIDANLIKLFRRLFSSKAFTDESVGDVDFCRHIAIGRRRFTAFPHI